MRHAKSAYPLGVADHDRPLSGRGLRDASAAQLWFSDHGAEILSQDPCVLVSTALRTQQTWQAIQSGLPTATVQHEPRIYEAAVSTLIDVCAPSVSAGKDTLLIGHNPGVEGLADFLADPTTRPDVWAQREKCPTAAIVVLEILDDSWAGASAIISDFIVPRG
ncbi:MAG: histidine phosphatase family protein [Actinomycetota bacterium]|nr:histidine phosphatase family protein [Actinomycetota bacterium]